MTEHLARDFCVYAFIPVGQVLSSQKRQQYRARSQDGKNCRPNETKQNRTRTNGRSWRSPLIGIYQRILRDMAYHLGTPLLLDNNLTAGVRTLRLERCRVSVTIAIN